MSSLDLDICYLSASEALEKFKNCRLISKMKTIPPGLIQMLLLDLLLLLLLLLLLYVFTT